MTPISNLNEFEGDFLNLEDRIKNKLLRVFCKYYLLRNNTSFDLNFTRDLEGYLIQHVSHSHLYDRISSRDEKREIVFEFIDIIRSFKDIYNRNEPLDPNQVYIKLQSRTIFRGLTEEMMRFIQCNYGYGFIIIIDGFDNINAESIKYKQFKTWSSELISSTNNNNARFNAVYLIAMREKKGVTS